MIRTNLTAIALAAAAFVSAPAFAQGAGEFMINPAFADPAPKECISTFDMQHCNAHELRVADARMSARYSALRARLRPAARQKLLTEQRAWLKSRDRTCRAKGDRYSGGTMSGVVTTGCWVDVTKARAKVLASRG